MTQRLNWGILATGLIADLFTRDLLLAGHQVAAVGSRSQDKAEAFARTHGIARVHGSYEALIADLSVDIVYVATPHPQHVAPALMALNAGKHVLVEKAFTLNQAEAAQIIEAGTIGEIRSITADHRQSLPDDPAHRLNNLELGGGALLDLGIYPISFTWDLLGKPASVLAQATFHATEADRQLATIFHHANGAMATTQSSSDSAGPNRAAVVGTKGWIEIDRTWYAPTTLRVYDNDNRVTKTFDGAVSGRGMQYQAAQVEALIRAGQTESAIMPAAQSVESMGLCDEIRRQIGLRYPSEPYQS